MYDGKAEVDELQKVPEDERAPAQTKALQELDNDTRCRPGLSLRGPNGELLSPEDAGDGERWPVYKKPIADFAVGETPAHRRRAALKWFDREGPPKSN